MLPSRAADLKSGRRELSHELMSVGTMVKHRVTNRVSCIDHDETRLKLST